MSEIEEVDEEPKRPPMAYLYAVVLLCVPISCAVFPLAIMKGGQYLVAYQDTVYAAGFSVSKFDEIEEGMTAEEVKSIIGKPILILNEDVDLLTGLATKPKSYEVWCYSSSTSGPYVTHFTYRIHINVYSQRVVSITSGLQTH